MRIRAGFAGSPVGDWTLDSQEIVTVEDLWDYVETHHWLPILHRGAGGVLVPKVLNTRMLTTITMLYE